MLNDAHPGFGEAPAPILAGVPGDVLPRIGRAALCDMLRRLPPDQLDKALRNKLVPVVDLPGVVLHVACGKPAFDKAKSRRLSVVACCEAEDLLAAARATHGAFLLDQATLRLLRQRPAFSASRVISGGQTACVLLLLLVAAGSVLWLPKMILLGGLALAGALFFLSVMTMRALCLMPFPRTEVADCPPLPEAELPVYSVLVPLFRETTILQQLIGAMTRLRYPAEKLDIKLILEEADMPMRLAVAALSLDSRFEVIVVPSGHPQTKPRALNYALAFCRGDYVTIYDAEDVPDPDQLLKAARRFAASPAKLACLQAQLTFYNSDENWLSRQFTAEYAVLFGLLLPALAAHGLPMPLGGTSNHFRAHVLREVGGWDPFNVTEDADLGVRLSRQGFGTAVLESFTHEEASATPGNWLQQRTRWLKGYLITWLVHMRQPVRLLKELGTAGFWAVQVLTLAVFVSALLHPLCLLLILAIQFTGLHLTENAALPAMLLAGLSLTVMAAGYGVAMVLMRRALLGRGMLGWGFTVISVPGYWCLMSVAAWMALWQAVFRPFHWNKTAHGVSRQAPTLSLTP
ncbi:glycosyltransferase family 2 protein [Aestuariivirga sp.]|uniref:glycosyltransferase family 2 protein n=1 Tax=Aestuariivirga sp. TaxID=2650926 RepID=UPI003783C423